MANTRTLRLHQEERDREAAERAMELELAMPKVNPDAEGAGEPRHTHLCLESRFPPF